VLQEEKASVEPPKDLKSKSRGEDGLTKEERRVLKKQRRQEERRLIATQLEKKRIEDEERTKKEKGRAYTLSIAIPGSIIDNAQTKELKTYLAGQVARAAVIFQVDEIIVFDDQLGNSKGEIKKKDDDCHIFMNRILQYLETPQYLRKALFPMHPDLKYAGLLNPLDCPHHIKSNEASVYREGVVTDRPLKENEGSHVYVGLQKDVIIDKLLQPGVRVTVKIDEESLSKKKGMKYVSATLQY
jgi:predicted SPOUT superfamily RNA methylase MTH1